MISVNNLTRFAVSEIYLKKVAKIVLKGENKSEGKEISIALISPAEIKKLNWKYRKKNQATDVLSFNLGDGFGEVVICPSRVEKNAGKNKTTFKKELAFVLIHGILHLLGYDHGIKMKKKEKYYFNEIAYYYRP